MMNFQKATTTQLETIFNHEYDLPTDLLVGLVTEMMNRNLFEGMIISTAKRLFNHYNRDEVLQVAYIGIFQLVKKIKHMKIPFKSLVYIVIERRLKSIIVSDSTIKNKMNYSALLNEFPVMIASSNVEKTVIDKMSLQEQLDKLTEKERYIVTEFLKGYSLNYQARRINKDSKLLHYHFKKSISQDEYYRLSNRA